MPDEFDRIAAARVAHRIADGKPVPAPDRLQDRIAADWRAGEKLNELAATKRRVAKELTGGGQAASSSAGRGGGPAIDIAEHERLRAAYAIPHAGQCRCAYQSISACPDLPAALRHATGLSREDAYSGRHWVAPEVWAAELGSPIEDRIAELKRAGGLDAVIDAAYEEVQAGMAYAFESYGGRIWRNTIVVERVRAVFVRKIREQSTGGAS